jgi:hypothetical protein
VYCLSSYSSTDKRLIFLTEKLFGVPLEELTLDNITCVVKGYCDANGKTPYDYMLNYDKAKDKKVDMADFFSALQVSNITSISRYVNVEQNFSHSIQ